MAARQRIDRVRREYNQWAANETLEDFALRFTAKKARRFSATQVGQTALGAVSFLALEAISGSITLHYGFTNTMVAIAVVCVIIFVAGLPICFHAAKYGVDIDLLTRGAGFGYIGSTVTSLIYASFTFILFAIESSIMAIALELCLGIPPSIGYLISALAVIPLVTHGITAISRFQVWTQPIWIALNILPVAAIILKNPGALSDWRSFAGSVNGSNDFQLLYFGEAASVALALIVQVGEQVDFLRFLPERRDKGIAWWIALLSAGPGWIIVGTFKLLAGSFLAVYLVRQGVLPENIDPPHMYASAFMAVVGSPKAALILTCIFVVVCQLKINVTNAYAGSIAWSNFFSRLTHSHPGRVVWLIFNVVLALLVMELGVYKAIEQTLAFYSSVAVAWVGAIVADLVINKPLGLSPPYIEFKRAHLFDVNPVGVGSMGIAVTFAVAAQLDLFGLTMQALAPFLSMAIALVCTPLIAVATRGRFYIARTPNARWSNPDNVRCCICENAFESEDMALCPAYSGPICSLCCSLDSRCQDMCKPHARFHAQLTTFAAHSLPPRWRRMIGPNGLEFLFAFLLSTALAGVVIALIGIQISADGRIAHDLVVSTLWKAFILLAIVLAIVSWFFVLVQVARRAAQSEMLRQAQLLMDEIDAHKQTDQALKKAKEAAEAANFAKSRYVVGLSHELRTPLNSIMGYAQLLERDKALAPKSRGQIAVMRRSANHLAGLIDGLLDISKIEAGKLDLARDEVAIKAFLAQIVDMFSVQAENKGIRFVFEASRDLPVIAAADEKRLRQLLINLLSNAVKFTQRGSVSLKVSYRNEVAEFLIEDTGPGIAPADLERIFLPFERLRAGAAEPGTGLGLTICRLLAGVMGGEISVTSELGAGSLFRLRLFLPRIQGTKPVLTRDLMPTGPIGAHKTILIADDDPVHRAMIAEALAPYAFDLHEAIDGIEALEVARILMPDLFLLDIEMPGLNGWQLAQALRESGHVASRIIMLSASAMEEHRNALAAPFHDAFIMKPVDIDVLIETIVDLLHLAPSNEPPPSPHAATRISLESMAIPGEKAIHALIEQAEIGYLRGLREELARISAANESFEPFVTRMLAYVEALDLSGLISTLERLREPTS